MGKEEVNRYLVAVNIIKRWRSIVNE